MSNIFELKRPKRLEMSEVDDFINLVKARPPLYNSSLLEYKSKAYCSVLWKEVGDLINKDASQCRTIWSSLRSSYARHLQNMENNVKGVNQRKKAEWYLSDKMAFLNEFMLRPPKERSLTYRPNDSNNTTSSTDDNAMSFFNFHEHTLNMDNNHNDNEYDNQSVITIKSEEPSLEFPLSPHSIEQNNTRDEINVDTERQLTEETHVKSYQLKKCRVELTSKDLNNHTPKRMAIEKELPRVQQMEPIKSSSSPLIIPLERSETRQLKKSLDEPKLTPTEELAYSQAREDSTVLFFQSILFDLRKLTDKKLRSFKQDILQELNKHLDEEENEE